MTSNPEAPALCFPSTPTPMRQRWRSSRTSSSSALLKALAAWKSLITYPATQTHSDLTEEERQSRGITECLLRLSVGIEDAGDLIDDLAQAIG